MARKSSGNEQSVSLFPFLAVLVCVMGSLIFLLLATTKRMHEIALAEAAAKLQPPPPIEPPTPKLSVPSDPPPAPLAASPDPAEVEQRRAQEQALQQRIANLQERREQLHQALERQQVLSQSSAKQADALQEQLRRGQTKLRGMLASVEAAERETGTPEELAALEAEIIELRRKLRQIQNRPQEGNSKFTIVPFDARSGTTRRPILIECTERGLRFLPEDVVVTPGDLDGFTERFNPLLTGAKTLIGYWAEQDRESPEVSREGEPYVLLIVRPNGTVAYYVAMKMLSSLKQPFGYELVDDTVTLQPPPLDTVAQSQCREAVQQQIASRSSAGLGGRGSGGGGGNGSGRGTGAGAGRGKPRDTFEVADIMPPETGVGERSWENFDRYEGRKNRGRTPGSSGGSAGDATGTANGGTGGGTGVGKPGGGVSNNPSMTPGNTSGGDVGGPPNLPNRRRSPAGARAGSTNGEPGDGTVAEPPEELPINADDPEPGSSRGASASGRRAGDQASEAVSGGNPDAGSSNSRGNRRMPQSGGNRNARRGPQGSNATGSSRGDGKEAHLDQLARRHWGQSEPGATIGIEQDVSVQVDAHQMVVSDKHVLAYRPGETPTDLFLRLLEVVDGDAQGWGKPRRGFYWTPRFRFVISPGGNQVFERIDEQVVKSGLARTKDFTLNSAQPAKGEAEQ